MRHAPSSTHISHIQTLTTLPNTTTKPAQNTQRSTSINPQHIILHAWIANSHMAYCTVIGTHNLTWWSFIAWWTLIACITYTYCTVITTFHTYAIVEVIPLVAFITLWWRRTTEAVRRAAQTLTIRLVVALLALLDGRESAELGTCWALVADTFWLGEVETWLTAFTTVLCSATYTWLTVFCA